MPFESVCKKSLKRYARRFSSLFCLGKDGESIFFSLVGCCLNRTSIDDLNSDSGPCPDVVLKLGRLPLGLMTAKCNLLLDESFEQARRMRLFRPDDVQCLDFHDVVYHGRRQDYSIKVLKDGRKRRVFRYGVAGVGRKKMFYTSRIRPCKTGEDTGDIVRELVWDQVPGRVLMDRFFGSVKVFDTVEALGREYIVPCKQTDKMDELYKKSLLSGQQCLRHTMRKHGGGKKQVDVHFLADEDYEYTSYYSNIAVPDNETDTLLAVYKIRWNIENQFKKKNEVQAKTSSPSPSYRLLLETIGYLLCNLWRLIVNTVQYVTMKKLARILLTLLRLIQDEPSPNSDKTLFEPG
jgi:hypothetical protein